MTKPVYKRLTVKQRQHLKEYGIPCTLQAIKEQARRLKEEYGNTAIGCRECAEIAYRLGVMV